ncbi:hypothetical protein Fmac_033044 [Flemingia macrophylla]|uniref:Uncharacterized protein n=1 Tax=Flemingia macrophylla TaxID=520843 RepID=A0ABD1L6N8_9FABA
MPLFDAFNSLHQWKQTSQPLLCFTRLFSVEKLPQALLNTLGFVLPQATQE